ncbi:unnamed protein product, partial [Prorocentrum cordatum]
AVQVCCARICDVPTKQSGVMLLSAKNSAVRELQLAAAMEIQRLYERPASHRAAKMLVRGDSEKIKPCDKRAYFRLDWGRCSEKLFIPVKGPSSDEIAVTDVAECRRLRLIKGVRSASVAGSQMADKVQLGRDIGAVLRRRAASTLVAAVHDADVFDSARPSAGGFPAIGTNDVDESVGQVFQWPRARITTALTTPTSPSMATARRDNFEKDLVQRAGAIFETREGAADLNGEASLCTPLGIIDDAGQASEVTAIVPMVRVVRSGGHLVVVGDPRQLSPTVLFKRAADMGLSLTFFDRLHDSLGYQLGDQGSACVTLVLIYRMRPFLMFFSSKAYCNRELLGGRANPLADRPLAPRLTWPEVTDLDPGRCESLSGLLGICVEGPREDCDGPRPRVLSADSEGARRTVLVDNRSYELTSPPAEGCANVPEAAITVDLARAVLPELGEGLSVKVIVPCRLQKGILEDGWLLTPRVLQVAMKGDKCSD